MWLRVGDSSSQALNQRNPSLLQLSSTSSGAVAMKSPATDNELKGIKEMTSVDTLPLFRLTSKCPGLLLYDEEERAAIQQLSQADAPNSRNGGSMEPTEDAIEAYREIRLWRHLRFVDTYRGFVEVSQS
jgi:hypothetical protein